jgi:hypothetical protein
MKSNSHLEYRIARKFAGYFCGGNYLRICNYGLKVDEVN